MAAVINLVAFQIGWFACVLGGAYRWPWAGTLVALAIVALHLWQVTLPLKELGLIILAGLIGVVADSALVSLGLTRFPSGTLVEGIAPHWIVAMWMIFATTLNVSLRWLKGRWWLGALFGAAGGPLAYYAGYKLGGVNFAEPMWHSLAALGIVWAIAMPLLMIIADRFDGAVIANRQTA